MKNDKVSVIVPVYNVAGTLHACIKSILNQSHKNIEVLLVDDGSTDGSSQICDEYALIDTRVVVIHQKNSGVSVARNTGIKEATSDYLCFVDGDDEIEHDTVETLINCKHNTDAQLIVAGISEYHRKLIRSIIEKTSTVDFSQESDSNIIDMCSNPLMVFMPSKLFLKSIFIENDLWSKAGLVCGEDHLLIYQYLQYVQKVSFVEKSLYRYYCFNSNGPGRFFPLSGQIDIFAAKKSFLQKFCSEENVNSYCARQALRNFIARIDYLAKRSIKDYGEIIEAYNFYWPYILPYTENQKVFNADDFKWLSEHKKELSAKDIKKLYSSRKKLIKIKKKNKKTEHIIEFIKMSPKKKFNFIKNKVL